MNEVKEKEKRSGMLIGHTEPIEITKSKLELAKLQDERSFELAKTTLKARHLNQDRRWRLFWAMLALIVIAVTALFFFTGEKYLKEFVALVLAFASGIPFGKFVFPK